MEYTFFCDDIPHTTRYAFSKEYKGRTWLKKAIDKLEVKGVRVAVTLPRGTSQFLGNTIYETGEGFINKPTQ